MLPVLGQQGREEERRGRHFHWLPSIQRKSWRLGSQAGQELFTFVTGLGVKSLLVVALRAGGRTCGALALGRTTASAAPYHASDLAIATRCCSPPES